MIKSAPTMVKKLVKSANYDVYKAWSSAVDDWIFTHMQIYPEQLGPSAVCSVAHMTLDPELYAALEGDGALGGRTGSSAETKWEAMMEHLRERLGCSAINLKIGLATLRQETHSMKEFARKFERRVQDAGYNDEDAKVLLVSNLNSQTLHKLDKFIATRDPSAAVAKETTTERLRRISYPAMISFLKQSNLSDIASTGAGGTGLVHRDPA